jgi:hypothetical protein
VIDLARGRPEILLCARVDDQHGARGVMNDLVADRAQHEAFEPAEASASYDDQVGVRGGAEQCLCGLTA